MNNFPVSLIIASRSKSEGITFGNNKSDELFDHYNCKTRPVILPRKPSMYIWVKFFNQKQRVRVYTPCDIYCSKREWMDCFNYIIPFEKSGIYDVEISGIEFTDINGRDITIYSDEHYLNSQNPTQWEEFSKLVRQQNYRKKYFQFYKLNSDDYTDYHIDHIVPVIECFNQGWTVEQTNDLSNLQLLSKDDNLKKGKKLMGL